MPTILRLHGAVEMRIPTAVGYVAIVLSPAEAIDYGTRWVAAGLGVAETEIAIPAPSSRDPQAPPPQNDPGDCDSSLLGERF